MSRHQRTRRTACWKTSLPSASFLAWNPGGLFSMLDKFPSYKAGLADWNQAYIPLDQFGYCKTKGSCPGRIHRWQLAGRHCPCCGFLWVARSESQLGIQTRRAFDRHQGLTRWTLDSVSQLQIPFKLSNCTSCVSDFCFTIIVSDSLMTQSSLQKFEELRYHPAGKIMTQRNLLITAEFAQLHQGIVEILRYSMENGWKLFETCQFKDFRRTHKEF